MQEHDPEFAGIEPNSGHVPMSPGLSTRSSSTCMLTYKRFDRLEASYRN